MLVGIDSRQDRETFQICAEGCYEFENKAFCASSFSTKGGKVSAVDGRWD